MNEDRSDIQRALVRHQPDGELYIVECCSVWQDDVCIGSLIIGVDGPIVRRDLIPDDEELVPSRALFDRIDAWEGDFDGDNAEWMQAEEDAGRVDYPIGVA